MTLNNGARTFRGNANCTVDDPSRFSLSMWLDPTITKFAPMSHFEKPLWDNRMVCTDAGWVQRWTPSKLNLGTVRMWSGTGETKNFTRGGG